MLKTRVLKVHPCLRILMMCIILHGKAKTLVAGSNSCEITRSTVRVVNGCPDSEESSIEAAERKNCSAYANYCDEPERLLYHCVINEYVNQTLEVCAYVQNKVLGKCTSYSISGNVVQANLRADCTEFKENSCSHFYRSDVAYNYPGCYQLTKKITIASNNSMSSRDPDTTAVFTKPSPNKHEVAGKEEKMNTNTATIAKIPPLLFVTIIDLIVFAV
uniref:Chitin-binding type-2 domain-containing protein n=1 Tax=Magallana gigas TaxID=29159 RepID=A0A8W8JNG7_MAGGI